MREILTYDSVRRGAGPMTCIPLLDPRIQSGNELPQSKIFQSGERLAALRNITKRHEGVVHSESNRNYCMFVKSFYKCIITTTLPLAPTFMYDT